MANDKTPQPGFTSAVENMAQIFLDEAKARKIEKDRCPEGFEKDSNMRIVFKGEPENEARLKYFRSNPEMFVIFDDAYDASGNLLEGHVAIYRKKNN